MSENTINGRNPGNDTAASGTSPDRPATATTTQTPLAIEWREPEGFLWLSLKNALLSLLTLGIYSFWGKTEVRRRIWNAIRINGEPLEYTGTGWELFRGFLLAFLLLFGGFILYAILIAAITGGDKRLMDLLSLPLYIIAFWLIGFATYRTWRYRLRRTRWRGIRGTLAGSPVKYANSHFLTGLAALFTLGWLNPWRSRRLHALMTRDTRFGSAPLRVEPEPALGPLYRPFALAWVGGILIFFLMLIILDRSFGAEIAGTSSLNASSLILSGLLLLAGSILIMWLWLRYSARSANWLTSHVRLHDGRFRLNLTPGGLFRLWLGNLLITALSLGILMPMVQKRTARYMVGNTSFEGTVDLSRLTQATDGLEKSGEGLGEMFDIDAF